MGRVVALQDFKRQKLADRAFRTWRRLFSEHPSWNADTAWKDVSDAVLLSFGLEKPEAQTALHDLITVCQERGHGEDFEAQAFESFCHLLNGYFYLMDQARFEIMARLGWVGRSEGTRRPILDLAQDPFIYEPAAMADLPVLRPDHPGYDEDRLGNGMERAVIVRKALPEAIRRMELRLERHTGC